MFSAKGKSIVTIMHTSCMVKRILLHLSMCPLFSQHYYLLFPFPSFLPASCHHVMHQTFISRYMSSNIGHLNLFSAVERSTFVYGKCHAPSLKVHLPLHRSGDFVINNELMQSVEETLQVDPSSEPWSDSEDETDHIEMEWEEVPCSLPELEGAARSTTCYISASQFNDPGSPSSHGLTGGLMSSVASLWRAATGTRDGPK